MLLEFEYANLQSSHILEHPNCDTISTCMCIILLTVVLMAVFWYYK